MAIKTLPLKNPAFIGFWVFSNLYEDANPDNWKNFINNHCKPNWGISANKAAVLHKLAEYNAIIVTELHNFWFIEFDSNEDLVRFMLEW